MPIKITLPQPFLSICTLECPALPDFAVLTGRNGAGKTQLLQALAQGHAQVHGVEHPAIERYDMDSFRPPNTASSDRQSHDFARATLRRYLAGDSGPAPVTVASEIYEEYAAELQRGGDDICEAFFDELRHRITRVRDFAVFPDGGDQGSDYERAVYARVMAPLAGGQPVHPSGFAGNPAVLVTMAMKLARKLPHELTRHDILRAANYEAATLANTISEVFAAYRADQYDWVHAQFEARSAPLTFADLAAEYGDRNPPPWNTLREVMAEMREASGEHGLFDFDFSDPASVRIDMDNYQKFRFKAEMTNRTTGARYELQTLSSGEKVLMSLCLASFNQRLGNRTPELLLLDELDAVLHPSMVNALVAAVRSLFIDRGCRVLMTTHSPMTVAALPETDVYRLVRTGTRVRVVPTTTSEAVEELSEGIATLDTGLRIASSGDADVTILTEGHNAHHLKRWVELHFPGRVHVFDRLAAHTSKAQLLTYGRMLGAMHPDTHFVVVWDCDAAKEAQTLREDLPRHAKVTPFAFARRSDNTLARRGIENNYDQDILEAYAITKVDSDGNVLRRDFDQSRKTEFARHVRQHATEDYFAHFGDLHVIVERILNGRSIAREPVTPDAPTSAATAGD